MKRITFLAVCLLILTGGLFAQETEAYIRDFSGTVEVRTPGSALWVPAQAGQKLSRETIISTGFKSTALVVLGNSTLTVRPLTRLSLKELQSGGGNETVSLNLQTGRIRADVSPPAGGKTEFTVRSPTATASVRGTSFDFDGVNLQVDEGRVYVSGGDGTAVYVAAGQGAVSDPETGRTAGAAETARAELSPAIPQAAAESIPAPAAIVPDIVPSNAPSTADLGLGFWWE
jgi:hypothetical protein